MRRPPPSPPPGAEVLQAGGRGGTGNIIYLFRNETPPLLLKVYRWRRSPLREQLKNFSESVLEGKRGATAAIRCETEKLNLDLWAREGFDVVQRVERPLPPSVTGPALWIRYYDATNLAEALADATRDSESKLGLCSQLGTSLSRRHTRAVELNQPLLVHEHGNVKHFLVFEQRLLAFDLEHGYKPGFPMIKAIAAEIAGITQSMARIAATNAGRFLSAFATGYESKQLLRDAVRQVVGGGGLRGVIRRRQERGNSFSRTSVMRQVGGFIQ